MSLADVNARIDGACLETRRSPSSVSLVAVSKSQSAQSILPLLAAGHSQFGENRVQEAEDKWPTLKRNFPDTKLHFIGHLQRNKAKDAVALFDVIQSVDRVELAAELGKEMDRQNRHIPCFIQVNTGEEPQKGGVTPKDLDTLFRFCREEAKLDIRGLMCIPPADDVPGLHFALLHKLNTRLGLRDLSMGMSADFETAIRYGATHIRVGSAIF